MTIHVLCEWLYDRLASCAFCQGPKYCVTLTTYLVCARLRLRIIISISFVPRNLERNDAKEIKRFCKMNRRCSASIQSWTQIVFHNLENKDWFEILCNKNINWLSEQDFSFTSQFQKSIII